ncbi:MAG: hypothetical protein HQ501_05910 [Rhodospirillales bacterium]|nr:hypothetical protein [Rhodospirillales bacterium]
MGRLNPGTINSVISVKPIDMSAINAIAPTRLNATDLMQTPVGASNSASPVSMEDLMALPVPTVQPAVPTSLAASAMAQGATQMVTQAATVIMEPGTGYLVVLSSNRDQRNARMTLEKLNLQGANIETLDVNGKPMYMVTIGPLPEPEARLVQGEAFDAGVLDAWLKKL